MSDVETISLAMGDEPAAETPPRPRLRWAGVVWGLVFAGLAAAGLWIVASDTRAESLSEWVARVDIGTGIAIGLLAIGGIILTTGLVGLLSRGQRAAARR